MPLIYGDGVKKTMNRRIALIVRDNVFGFILIFLWSYVNDSKNKA